MSPPGEVWRARFAMVGVVLCWSGAFSAIKVSLRYLTPLDITLLRFLGAALPFALILLWQGLPRLERREWRAFVVMALASVGGYHLALNWGETFVSAGVAALIVATGPMWTALFSALLVRERLPPVKLFGIAIALAGVAVIVLASGKSLGVKYALGALVLLLAPILWAYQSVLAKPLVMKHGAERMTAAATLAGTAVLLPALATGAVERALVLPREGWIAIAFLALLATVLGYLGFNYALKRLSASEATTFVYLNPVFGLAWGFLLLGERPSLLTLAGGAVVILGIVLANLRTRAPAAPTPVPVPTPLSRSEAK